MRRLAGHRFGIALLARLAQLSVFAGATTSVAQVPIWRVTGETADEHLGTSIASIPDLDGDTFDDLVIGSPTGVTGAPLSPTATPSPLAPGHCRVVSGKTGQTILTLVGPGQPGDLFGFSVAVIGDTNLDGVPEIAVGAPRNDSSFNALAGSVSVYSGATGGLRYRIVGSAPNDFFGTTVIGHGDANLDGLPDAVGGAPFVDGPNGVDSGAIRLFVGTNGFTLKTVNGAAAGDGFGGALAPIADFTGDGFPDFAVGAPNAFDAGMNGRPGRVTLHSASGTAAAAILGATDGDRFGTAIATIPDFTGDGKADVLVGAPGFGAAASVMGQVSIISTQSNQSVFTYAGTTPGEGLGVALVAISDLDASPAQDFAVASMDGRVRFVSGSGATLGTLEGVGGFGAALVSCADQNGDGERELAIGAPLSGTGSLDQTGSVSLHAGPTIAQKILFANATPVEFTIVKDAVPDPIIRNVVGVGFGSQDFEVSIPSGAPWLLVTPLLSTIDGLGDFEALSFSIDSTKLGSATAATVLTLRDPNSLGILTTLEVAVKPAAAGADPVVCSSAPSVDFTAPQGVSNPAPVALSLSNCGNESLLLQGTISIEPPSATWLTIDAPVFSIAPGAGSQSVLVSCDATSLAPGQHVATLRLTNSFVVGQVVDIPVTVLAGSAKFALGDKLKGEIADAAETDLAVFDGIEGLPVEFKGGPKNGSKPKLTLLAPDGRVVDTWVPATAKTKRAFVLDRAGVWRLRVESGDGAGGEFLVKTKRDGLPANAVDIEKTITIDSPPFHLIELGALPGCKIVAAKIAPKSQPIGDLTFSLETPNGGVFDVTSFDSLGSKSYSLAAVPLVLGGTWRFTIGGLVAGSKVKLEFDLAQPKVGKQTITID